MSIDKRGNEGTREGGRMNKYQRVGIKEKGGTAVSFDKRGNEGRRRNVELKQC